MTQTAFDPHDPSLREASVLSTAVAAGNVAWVEACLAAGADPSRHVGIPLPLLAVARHHAGVLECLIKAHADLDEANEYGFTALHQAARTYPDMVPVLLAAGADPNARDCNGRPPLAYAIINGHRAAAAALIETGIVDPHRDMDPVTRRPYADLDPALVTSLESVVPTRTDAPVAVTAEPTPPSTESPRTIGNVRAVDFGLSRPATPRRPSV